MTDNEQPTVSKCCLADTKVEGNFRNKLGGTFYYVCQRCQQPCDFVRFDAKAIEEAEFPEERKRELRERLRVYQKRDKDRC